jgi:hypothetical protein
MLRVLCDLAAVRDVTSSLANKMAKHDKQWTNIINIVPRSRNHFCSGKATNHAVRDFRLPPLCKLDMRSSGILRGVEW